MNNSDRKFLFMLNYLSRQQAGGQSGLNINVKEIALVKKQIKEEFFDHQLRLEIDRKK